MFSFPEPPAPRDTKSPCPHCGATRGVPVYATSIKQYLRCIQCGFITLERRRA